MDNLTPHDASIHRKYYVVVTPFFPTNESFRGPFIYDQVKAIERVGKFKVVVFRPKALRDKRTDYEYGGVKVHFFKAIGMPSYFFNGFTNDYNARQFLKLFKTKGIDIKDVAVVHCHTSTFCVYGLILKDANPAIKVLLQHHDRDPFCILNGKLSSWYPNLLYRAKKNYNLYQRVDLHVCVSKITEDNLLNFPSASSSEDYPPYIQKLRKLRNMKPLPEVKSVVLYNGVDTSKFYSAGYKKAKVNCNIGCVANFQDLKDQITLIKAVEVLVKERGLSGLKASFIGSGPELSRCVSYVEEAKLHDYIVFEKEVDHEKLCVFYNSLDLFVLPSVYEGFGCVFTEAYACGVPFMICEGQGATEYIPESDYGKWVFGKHDYNQLADRIENFIGHRFTQKLKFDYDIDALIDNFLKKI